MARAHVHRMLRLCVAFPKDLPEVQCACVKPNEHGAHYIERFYSAHLCPTLVVIHPVVTPNCSLASSISRLNNVHLQKVPSEHLFSVHWLCTDLRFFQSFPRWFLFWISSKLPESAGMSCLRSIIRAETSPSSAHLCLNRDLHSLPYFSVGVSRS